MSDTLAELFERHQSDTVNHRGRIVKAVVRLPVYEGGTITVRRRHANDARPQGLTFALDAGELVVGHHRAAALTLWATTSPAEVSMQIEGEHASTVDVWNVWSLGGVETCWIGNAGIVTRATGTGTVLRCSDGIGQPDFSDLEVEVELGTG